MALIATQGIWLPSPRWTVPADINAQIDATGEMVAYVGRVWNKDRATKDITKVGFRWGSTITKAGGSALTVSLQNVSTTAAILAPDGTQDQTVAISNANIGAAGTWHQTAALSANRTVAFGELLAVVIEYDGGGRVPSDVITLNGMNVGITNNSAMMLFTSSWAVTNGAAGCVLEFTDGTFGTFDGAIPALATQSIQYKSDSTPDERALKFRVPFPCKIDGVWLMVSLAAGCNYDVVLYEGTTALVTVSTDADQHTLPTAFNGRVVFIPITETTLTINTDYYIGLKPTTTTNGVQFYTTTVSAANHFQGFGGGVDFHYASRTDAGAWTAVTTERPFAGIRISAIDDGAGGGGGGVVARVIGS